MAEVFSFSPVRVFLKNVDPHNTTSAVWTALLQMGLGGGLQHVHAARSRGYSAGQPVNYFLTYETMEQVNHIVQVLNGQYFLSRRPVVAQVAAPRLPGTSYPSQAVNRPEGCTPKLGAPKAPWRAASAVTPPAPCPLPEIPPPAPSPPPEVLVQQGGGNEMVEEKKEDDEKKNEDKKDEEKKDEESKGEENEKKDEDRHEGNKHEDKEGGSHPGRGGDVKSEDGEKNEKNKCEENEKGEQKEGEDEEKILEDGYDSGCELVEAEEDDEKARREAWILLSGLVEREENAEVETSPAFMPVKEESVSEDENEVMKKKNDMEDGKRDKKPLTQKEASSEDDGEETHRKQKKDKHRKRGRSRRSRRRRRRRRSSTPSSYTSPSRRSRKRRR